MPRCINGSIIAIIFSYINKHGSNGDASRYKFQFQHGHIYDCEVTQLKRVPWVNVSQYTNAVGDADYLLL
jgi:hypothetical protein